MRVKVGVAMEMWQFSWQWICMDVTELSKGRACERPSDSRSLGRKLGRAGRGAYSSHTKATGGIKNMGTAQVCVCIQGTDACLAVYKPPRLERKIVTGKVKSGVTCRAGLLHFTPSR